MAVYTVHLNRSCTVSTGTASSCNLRNNGAEPCFRQSVAGFQRKGQSSIADQSMWTYGGHSGSGTSRPSSTSVFISQYYSTTAPYSHFIHHRHHKILPTHSIFRQHIKKSATSIITPSSENMDDALDNIFLSKLHLYKGKCKPPCKRHIFPMYGTKQHCTVRFPATHAHVQASTMRMWHGNKYRIFR